MRIRLARLLVLVLAVLGAGRTASYGQSTNATVGGRVTDQAGRSVPGATVVLTNLNTNVPYTTQTNDQGTYSLPNLPPGIYRENVTKDGFKSIVKGDIELHVQDNASINFQLEVGSVSQTITVEGGTPLINTQSAAVSMVVDRQFVENMPLNGRSFQQLISLTPGIVLTKATFTEAGQFSVNGQRANANYFSVDGVSANVGVSPAAALGQSAAGSLPGLTVLGGTNSLVSVDALQEFKIQTSSYAPEFGRSPGGQIQILTRSGTNDFHGTLFEYFRNDALDATDWFANAKRLPKPPIRQNDFGGVFGGPIWKDHTFFFFSYEGLRLRQPQTATILVPSLASRQTALPQIRQILNGYPIPNGTVLANGFAEFSASYGDPSTLDATSIRIDHAVSNRISFFGRYNKSHSRTSQRVNSLSTIDNTQGKIDTLTLGSIQSISSTVSNDVRGNYSQTVGANFRDLDTLGGAVVPPGSILLPPFAPPEASSFLIQFDTGGGASLGVGRNVENKQRQINVIDNLSVAVGVHQLKFGVDYRWLSPTNSARNYDLTLRFANLAATSTGALQSVLVGARTTTSLIATSFSLYGQDIWKIKPSLTLTYGLRWEVNPPPRGKGDTPLYILQNFTGPAANITLSPPATPLYETTYGNLAPRVGLAYQLFQRPGRETILRGGVGIFYDLGSGGLGTAASSFPYTRQKQLPNVIYPLTADQLAPPPVQFSFGPGTVATLSDPNLQLPRTYQWNLAVEKSLGSYQVGSVSYVGAAGRRLLRQEDLRPQGSGIIRVTKNTAKSDYHAMQLQFRRRLSTGLQVLASYTWSHSIDTASNDSGTLPPEGVVDPNNDRGSSDFDIRHSFSSAITCDIPGPRTGSLARALFANWSTDVLLTARSATPVELVGRTNSTGFFSPLRPDLVPGVSLYLADAATPRGRRFNPAAFVAPPVGRQGTLGRNVLRGFPAWQMDFSLRRQFSLTEPFKLQLRAEAFNIFNHPNFGDPVRNLSSAQFGRSTQMLGRSLGGGGVNGGFNPLYQVGGPRSMQFALRLIF